MTPPVVLRPDPEDGGSVVSCPALPGCHSQGETLDEALANIREALANMREAIALCQQVLQRF